MDEKPKILTLDIETSPNLAYTWGLFKQNISINQIDTPGKILCFAAKYLDTNHIELYSDWEHGQIGMLRAAAHLIEEADAVVTYNGDGFDLKWFQAEFFAKGIPMPPPVTSIDLYKTVRNKMRFLSNKLDYVANYIGIGKKVKHEGFDLWRKVIDGDRKAQARMERYCRGDVRLTEKLYKRLRPYIVNHPHMGMTKSQDCGACGSSRVQSRGYRRTRAMRVQRLHCQNCGSWQDGSRQKVA